MSNTYPIYAMAKTILIADDDTMIVRLFHLDAEGKNSDLTIHSAETGESAIETLMHSTPDLLVLDIRMPKGDGFSVLEHMKEKNMDIPVVILTNYRSDEYLKKSKTYSNVKEYIVKHEVRMEHIMNTVNAYL